MLENVKSLGIGALASIGNAATPPLVDSIIPSPVETGNIVTAIVQAIIAVATLFSLFKKKK